MVYFQYRPESARIYPSDLLGGPKTNSALLHTRQCARNIAGLLVEELVGPLLPYGILCIPRMYPSSVVTKCSSISYPQYLTSSGCKKISIIEQLNWFRVHSRFAFEKYFWRNSLD